MKKYSILSLFILAGLLVLFNACDLDNINELGTVEPELVEFRFAEFPSLPGTVDRDAATVTIEVPNNADLSQLTLDVEPSLGAMVDPPNGTVLDFSTAQHSITISNNGVSKSYNVTAVRGGLDATTAKLLVIGLADSPDALENEDEKFAVNWALETFTFGQYASFDQIANDPSILDGINVVWYHADTSPDIPPAALSDGFINAMQSYYQNNGQIYLTSFAVQMLEPLGIVGEGEGPNETGGAPTDFDNPDNWGISYVGDEDHPAFKNLPQAGDKSYAASYLISGGASRKDNKTWWVVSEGFPEERGISLAGTEWDPDREVLILMAEFPGQNGAGTAMAFGAGAQDFVSAEGENAFINNLFRLTENILVYLARKSG